MESKKRVCCILLNWNSPDHTKACLTSLARQVRPPDTIVVCDNGSTDGSGRQILSWVQRLFPKQLEVLVLKGQDVRQSRFPKNGHLPGFVFIQNDKNQGFAVGNNLCLKWALTRRGYSFIWMLNPDTWVQDDALQALLRCAESGKKAAVWGSTVCFADKPHILQCAAGYTYTPWNTLIRPVLGGEHISKALGAAAEPSLDYILGASMFLKVELLQKIGGLCEDLTLFYEELDLCNRAKKAGYGLGWCRASLVYHHSGTSFKAQSAAVRSHLRKIAYHETLSTLVYTQKFYAHLLPWVIGLRLGGKFCCLVKRRQLFLFKPVLKACVDLISGRWIRPNAL